MQFANRWAHLDLDYSKSWLFHWEMHWNAAHCQAIPHVQQQESIQKSRVLYITILFVELIIFIHYLRYFISLYFFLSFSLSLFVILYANWTKSLNYLNINSIRHRIRVWIELFFLLVRITLCVCLVEFAFWACKIFKLWANVDSEFDLHGIYTCNLWPHRPFGVWLVPRMYAFLSAVSQRLDVWCFFFCFCSWFL